MWCASVPHRTVLSVTGADAFKFLNGIISSSIANAPSRAPFYTTFIHAQARGRVIAEAFVHPHPTDPTGFLIEHDTRESEAPTLAALLKRYVLRSKVKVTPVADEWDVWAAWNDAPVPISRRWRWARSGCIEPVFSNASPWTSTQPSRLLDIRGGGLGTRILVRKNDTRDPEASDHDVVDSWQYTLHRVLNGVAEGISEIIPMHAFPMESNLDIMGAVDFRKGCYVGQELTVRTYHMGTLRKRIFPIQIHKASNVAGAATPPVGSDIRLSVPASLENEIEEGTRKPKPRPSGKLLTAIPWNGAFAGLALLRLEHLDAVERGELDLSMSTETGSSWSVRHHWPKWFPKRGVDEVLSDDD
ncbi:Aminomethyltransferase folate-binding domain-containing protein [Auriculariales sp. MPI-PUGE-AT-0066]|nr:Aminomethyltransferase folate-binding domain-containing protein [Auriculariales sp. MPI-PUGE-AT-0066]